MIHSCGDVDELFDELIALGVNCFNPFQPEVMDVYALLPAYRGRLAFHGEDALVFLKGDVSHKEFWLVDLQTGRERQLTTLGSEFVIGDFDVSPDGREIVFDRAREESDIVLIDLPNR
jgi:hypothetical protein